MSSDLVTVALMTPDDLDEIMPLERQCFADPWTRRMYLSDLTTNALATYLVVRRMVDGRLLTMDDRPTGIANGPSSMVHRPSSILAYGGFWLLMDEAHIATIASHPDWRGCGLGQWLMLALIDAAIARGAASSTLEVRAGNLPARRLYEKLGYEVTGLRKNYYRDGEDGLIMTTPSMAEPAMQARLAAARADVEAKLKRCLETRT
jgi:[ribosomal protein S18]-alanine N-acetyltransferase